jgi:hypothetical protein
MSAAPPTVSGPSVIYPTWARLAYVLALLAVVFLLSFVSLVTVGPMFRSGESWEGVAIYWFMAWPAFLLLCAGSALVYPTYRRAASWGRVLTVFLANVFFVILLGQGLTVALSVLFPMVGRWLLFWAA